MKDGELIQCETPEQLLTNPKNEFVRSFFDDSLSQKEQTVKEILLAKNYTKGISEKDRPVVQFNTPLNEVFALLVNHESVKIQENERISGEIKRGDMFAFLSRKEEDNEKV